MSLADPDIDARGIHKDGRMVPLVIDVQQTRGHMNLIGRMASNMIWYANYEVTIQFYADAARQLRTTERSAMPLRRSYSASLRLSAIVSIRTRTNQLI